MSQFPTSLYYMFPIINLVIALYKVNIHTLKLCLCHKQWSTSKMREKLQWHHLGLFGQARQSHRHYCKTVFSVHITLIYCPWKKKINVALHFTLINVIFLNKLVVIAAIMIRLKKKEEERNWDEHDHDYTFWARHFLWMFIVWSWSTK